MRALLLILLLSPAAAAEFSTEERRRALLLADLLIDEERLAEADDVIARAYAVELDTAPWALRLARLRGEQGRHAESAALYRRLLADQGDDSGLLLMAGMHAYSAGQLDAAREAFLRARELTQDPMPPYYLSELAFSADRRAAGRRWAREALEKLKTPRNAKERRLALRLRARVEWKDSLHEEFGRLYDKHPEEETLSEWARALMAAGRLEAAEEPAALMRERHGSRPGWRRLRADLLKRSNVEEALAAHLEESAAAWPDDASFQLSLGELELRRRRWGRAEARLERSRLSEEHRRQSEDLLVEARWRGWHRAGPLLRWRESRSARTLESGASYHGYARPGLKLDAEAVNAGYRFRTRSASASLSGGRIAASLERGAWTAGADFDARAGAVDAASPGLFGSWRGRRGYVEAEASAARAWRDTPEAVLAGAAAHQLEARAQRRFGRFFAGGTASLHLARAGGGDARQSVLSPEAGAVLLESPFYSALSYRLMSVDVRGDEAFFARLPLLRRARTQFAVLSVGRWWLRGRLRADGYVFNGHEPERGRRFGHDDLVGFGAGLEWYAGRVRLAGTYETTQDHIQGVGGVSRTARLSAQWRWAP